MIFASIIIPCRTEEKFIGKCLDSIISQDFPKEKLEVLVIDGMSEDRTRKIIENYSRKFSFIKLIDNPNKFTPFALNIGIRRAKGNFIIRMDTHATYEKDYVSKCLKYLAEYGADNVGGMTKIVPAENTAVASAIAISSGHPFGVGNSYYKRSFKKIRWVDTVFGGCYKKEVFEKIGLFNENLIRSQDIEFNLRLKRAGGKILLVPDIVSYYYPKSTLGGFFFQNFKNGIWAIYPLKFIKMPLRLRHYIPFLFVSGLLVTAFLGFFLPIFWWLFLLVVGLYVITSFYFSIKIAIKKKNFLFSFLLPLVFAIYHFSYGLGSIFGLIKLLTK